MSRTRTLVVYLGIAAALYSPATAAESESESSLLLHHFLAAEQAGTMELLGNWLETYNLERGQVERLIAATQSTSSEERRNLLWHALRCTRTKAAREYLLKNLVEDTDETTRIRFVKSLTILAPFDVPLLTALYQSSPPPQIGRKAGGTDDRSGDPTLAEEIVRLATLEYTTLAGHVPAKPEFIKESAGSRNSLTYIIGQYRQKNATQAKAELLTWIAKNAATEKDRLAVILPAYEILESAHQKQLARDLLEIVKKPDERARIMPLICQRYGIDLYPLLIKDDETETAKLGVIQALHMLGSSYGYSLSSISHGRNTLLYVSKNDPSPKVRDAAQRLLQRLAGTRGTPDDPP